ncbi:MAG: NupC/NupG family nucleoside CNT transporter [Puniceicoccaceae bacterium MED-G30]|jgi:CNT family concentrative nucleoside transporter|nr:MAG: NupC/NupG family nucleoside CNT transporter [Puniceicoccaceae bacterium MED-G30]RPG86442.1 MAG: NupC/NupG family nucleoside CNT transporter [Coraliomargarita sp. TMED73]RPG86881.1 MAG: NupC/NupG family nucleoside CNT transporter [Coraliomargarita sp. TMED73]|tara:strand:+ start:1565 stop:2794 length:1230 start_codon:yes stop_codon:yes gene_type:complete
MNVFVGLLGAIALFLFAWFLSSDKKKINWRTIIVAFALQVCLGAFVIYVPFGKALVSGMSSIVTDLLEQSKSGAQFVFSDLADEKSSFYFAFQVLPVIVFFSSLVSVLYHYGIMQFLIRTIGGWLQFLLRTSRTESMVAAANMFLGITESPLTVKPYLLSMTRSQLFAVMVCGLSSVAGSVLAGLVAMGISLDYLITAAVMAAPGGLMMAKLLEPETDLATNESSQSKEADVVVEKSSNVFEAATNGASSGLALCLNIAAMLIAFIGIIALLNFILGWVTSLVGFSGMTVQVLLGWVFSPIAILLGVQPSEANVVASLMGQKVIFNEFVAFADFVQLKETLSIKSQAIATFALCGFANFSSIGIMLGGLSIMAPSRKPEVAKLSLRALIAATMANFMSAAIAGIFIQFA